MAVLNPHEFYQLLENLTVADNTLRQATEAHYHTVIREQPDQAVIGLLLVLSTTSVEFHLRQLSAVLLRRALIVDDSVYYRLSSGVASQLQTELLRLLLEETNTTVRLRVCDIAGELGGALLEPKDWPALPSTAVALCHAPQPADREVGLSLLAQLAESQIGADEGFLATLIQVLSTSFHVHQRDPKGLALTMKALNFAVQAVRMPSQLDILRTLVETMFASLGAMLEHVLSPEAVNLPTGWNAANSHVSHFLEHLVDLADHSASFFNAHLEACMPPLLDLIEPSRDLPMSLKFLVMEFIVLLTVSLTKRVRKLRCPTTGEKDYFASRALPICLAYMSMLHWQPSDEEGRIGVNLTNTAAMDAQWVQADSVEETNYENNPADVAESALSRICAALGVRTTYGVISQLLSAYLPDGDWQRQYAGLQCIAIYVETSVNIPGDAQLELHRKEVLGTLLHFLGHEHPRVRYSALYALSAFLRTHGGSLDQQQLLLLVANVIEHTKLEKNPSPRVRRNAIIALIQFVDMAPPALLGDNPHYSTHLLDVICSSLKEGPTIVQESCVSALVSLAEVSKKSDAWPTHYSSTMPILKTLLQLSYRRGLESLWAQTLECITVVGESVGKALFYQDAMELMDLLAHVQQQLNAGKSDASESNELEIELTKAWVRIARCLGTDFLPYLPVTIERIFLVLNQDITNGAGDEDDDDDDDQSGVEMIETNDGWITVRTSVIEEQSAAVQMVMHLASSLQEHYYVYVESTLKLLHKLIVSPHEDVRSFTVATLPELVRVTGKAQPGNRAPVVEVATFCCGLLVRFVETEEALDLIMTGLQALRQILFYACADWEKVARAKAKAAKKAIATGGLGSEIDSADPQVALKDFHRVLDESQMRALVQCLKVVLRDSLQRRAILRAEAQTSGLTQDEDDQEDEQRFFKESLELHFNISEVLGALLQTHTTAFFPLYMEEWHEMVQNLSHPYCLPEDRRFAFLVVSDVIRYGLPDGLAADYLRDALPALHEVCTMSSDVELKRSCAFTIGIAYECHAKVIHNQLPAMFNESLQALRATITTENDRARTEEGEDEDRGVCIDNAVAAVGIITEQTLNLGMAFHQEYLLAQWLQHLPLKHDKEEGEKSILQLVRLLRDYSQVFTSRASLLAASVAVLLVTIDTTTVEKISSECAGAIYELVMQDQMHQIFRDALTAELRAKAEHVALQVQQSQTSTLSTSPLATAPIHDVLFRPM